MDPTSFRMFMAAAVDSASEPAIGDSYGGGFFVGYISMTADGNATHRLICAPKDTGCGGRVYSGAGRKALISSGSSPTGTNDYDGASNTALYTIANSPILTFVTGLSLGGYTDWYLPAQLEYEIAYYNLKPGTTDNNTGRGINAYSAPEQRTSNYTSTDPSQTSLSLFQSSSGAEHFSDGSSSRKYHISSTVRFGGNNWSKDFNNGRRISSSITHDAYSYCAFRKESV